MLERNSEQPYGLMQAGAELRRFSSAFEAITFMHQQNVTGSTLTHVSLAAGIEINCNIATGKVEMVDGQSTDKKSAQSIKHFYEGIYPEIEAELTSAIEWIAKRELLIQLQRLANQPESPTNVIGFVSSDDVTKLNIQIMEFLNTCAPPHAGFKLFESQPKQDTRMPEQVAMYGVLKPRKEELIAVKSFNAKDTLIDTTRRMMNAAVNDASLRNTALRRNES